MAEKKTKIEKLEKEYTIPLRWEWNKVPRYKRANKAVKAIKEFLVRHMKIYDRDLKKIKIDKYLNEFVWFRGIRNPPARIKVKAVKEGEIVKVELFELPENLKFKKAREDKGKQKAEEKGKKKKEVEKPDEKTEIKSEEAEKKDSHEFGLHRPSVVSIEETEEKKATVIEVGQQMEKEIAQKTKHQTKQSKQPKRPVRQALQK